MVELVDTLVLGTSAYGVGVRLPLAAQYDNKGEINGYYGLGKFHINIAIPIG